MKEKLTKLIADTGLTKFPCNLAEYLLENGVIVQSEGEWIENEHDFYYTCSVCDFDWTIIEGTPSENNMNFCPNCGSKMKGGEG